MTRVLGGIEGGGTKFVCVVGTGPDDIRAELRYPTTTPEATLARAVTFFRDQEARHGAIEALGFAPFGPVDPDPASPSFGTIRSTPKPAWTGADVVGALAAALAVPIGFDTDVNGAALGEWRWGAGRGCDPMVYLTVGTGIGGGAVVGGEPLHGLVHPEMGHMRVPVPESDQFAGICPFHRTCLEGMASGPAIEARWGRPADRLGDREDAAVALEARYLGTAIANIVLVLSPRRIVLGGGVMGMAGLLDATRSVLVETLNGYVDVPEIIERPSDYLVAPGLGARSGVVGALELARRALR
jgi:fructokinase